MRLIGLSLRRHSTGADEATGAGATATATATAGAGAFARTANRWVFGPHRGRGIRQFRL